MFVRCSHVKRAGVDGGSASEDRDEDKREGRADDLAHGCFPTMVTGGAAPVFTRCGANSYWLLLGVGRIASTTMLPPLPCTRVKLTRIPGFRLARFTSGPTGKSIVIAGQPSALMEPWLRLTVCRAWSTSLTVPAACTAPV